MANSRGNVIIAETERLILRELTPEDASFAFELNNDPEVIKYTGDAPFESQESARMFLEKYDHYTRYGFGRWGVVLKENQELIGWCGLKYTFERSEHDIGFRFLQKHWGKGYATETAKSCIELGFKRFNLHTIIGRAMHENLRSINVLKKLGMIYWKDDLCGEEPGVIYRIMSH